MRISIIILMLIFNIIGTDQSKNKCFGMLYLNNSNNIIINHHHCLIPPSLIKRWISILLKYFLINTVTAVSSPSYRKVVTSFLVTVP